MLARAWGFKSPLAHHPDDPAGPNETDTSLGAADRPQRHNVRTDVRTDFVIVRILETSGKEGQDFTAISDLEIYQSQGAGD